MSAPRGAELRLDSVEMSRQQVRGCHRKLDQCAAAALRTTQSATDWPYPVQLYLHALVVEDITVRVILLESAPIYTTLFRAMVGPTNGPALRQYARAVHDSTDAYLAQLPSNGLERIIDLGRLGLGQRTVAWVIQRFVVAELDSLSSKIAEASAATGGHGTAPSRRRSLRNLPSLVAHDRFPL
jgi:hypothetical protein